MKKILLLSVFALFLLSSCEKYDEEVMPIVGVYEATIAGVSGPFTLTIASEYGDNIVIDAPWLSDQYTLIDADVDEIEYYRMEIDIHTQSLDGGVLIFGEGIFQDDSIQIDYTIEDGNDRYHYTIVGTKL